MRGFSPSYRRVAARNAIFTILVSAIGHEECVVGALSAPYADALLATNAGEPLSPDGVEKGSGARLPEGKRIAVVLRGETFRYYKLVRLSTGLKQHTTNCARDAVEKQMNCTKALLNKVAVLIDPRIPGVQRFRKAVLFLQFRGVAVLLANQHRSDSVIEPLENKGNTVELFFTSLLVRGHRQPTLQDVATARSSSGECLLNDMVTSALQANSSRAVKRSQFATTGQADTILKALGVLNDECGGADRVGAKFDYIMILRNDVLWNEGIDRTLVDFDRFNVLDLINTDYVDDTVWVMPGKMYAAFTSSIGRNRCFDPATDPEGNGHHCQTPIGNALAEAGYDSAFVYMADTKAKDLPPPGSHDFPLPAAMIYRQYDW